MKLEACGTYVESCDQNVIPAIFCRVMRASVLVHTPVTGECGGDAGGAGRVGIAVKKDKVSGHKVIRSRTLLEHPHGECGSEVVYTNSLIN